MYEPLTKEFLLARGTCCHTGCTNCPYQTMNKPTSDNEAVYTLVNTRTKKVIGKPAVKPIAEAIQQNYAYGLNRSDLQYVKMKK